MKFNINRYAIFSLNMLSLINSFHPQTPYQYLLLESPGCNHRAEETGSSLGPIAVPMAEVKWRGEGQSDRR